MIRLSPFQARFLLTTALLAWAILPSSSVPGALLSLRGTLQDDQLNAADYERMERGYYEHLIDAGRRLNDVAEVLPDQPAKARLFIPFDAGPLALPVNDLREFVLKPNLSVEHWGVRWTTNAWGLRDRAYAPVKPPGCARIALVGDSIAVGWGVPDEAGFEPLLERALNERSRSAGGPTVEILNFAVPGYAPGQRWDHFSRVGWTLGTDLLIYEATLADPGWDERRLRGLLAKGIGWDSPLYREALARARIRPGGDLETYKWALRRWRWELLKNVYKTIVADCRARNVPIVWVLIPRIGKAIDPAERDRLMDLARESGFSEVIDLSNIFDGLDPASLAISPTDYHPNAAGHALLARQLEAALVTLAEVQRLLTVPPTGGAKR